MVLIVTNNNSIEQKVELFIKGYIVTYTCVDWCLQKVIQFGWYAFGHCFSFKVAGEKKSLIHIMKQTIW